MSLAAVEHLCSEKLAYVIINTAFGYSKVVDFIDQAKKSSPKGLSIFNESALNMNYRLCFALLFCLNNVQAEDSDPSCHGQTALEINYCSLISRGATGLPPLYEFRKNSSATQYLLLKRPAAKLGITLSAPPRAKTPSSPTPAAAPDIQTSRAPQPTGTKMAKPKRLSLVTPSGCQIANEVISCGAEHFQLQWNKQKTDLAEGALGAGNQLQFPSPPANTSDAEAYLLQCYLIYIQKMLAIGLGNTTLSFAKFDGIYNEAKIQQFDFAARFKSMYHYLKEERKTMQPPKGFGQAKPQQIDDCMKLSDTLWTCHTSDHHWVYAKN